MTAGSSQPDRLDCLSHAARPISGCDLLGQWHNQPESPDIPPGGAIRGSAAAAAGLIGDTGPVFFDMADDGENDNMAEPEIPQGCAIPAKGAHASTLRRMIDGAPPFRPEATPEELVTEFEHAENRMAAFLALYARGRVGTMRYP